MIRLLAFALLFTIPLGWAQTGNYPNRAVKFVVPFPAGGPVDSTARTVGQKMTQLMHQPVIIENRPGAAMIIGIDAIAKAPGDGYSWLIVTNGIVINPSVYSKLPYDTVNDLAAVSHLTNTPYLLIVHPSLPIRTLAQFIQLAQKKRGQLLYSSSGIGSANHLPVVQMDLLTQSHTTHVPYKGTAQSLTAVVAGEVDFQLSNPFASAALVRAGKLRALATGGVRRLHSLHELPTFDEAGIKNFSPGPWFGLFTSAQTAPALVHQFNAWCVQALNDPEVSQKLTAEGAEIIADSPEQFTQFVKKELQKWAKVVATAGIKAN